MAMSVKDYKKYSEKLLDFTLITYILLFLIGTTFYFAAFDINVVNTIPLVLILTLGVFTWALRYRLDEIDEIESIRALLVQWTVVTILGVLFNILILFTYPIS